MANNSKKYASLTTLQTFLDNLKNLFITKTDVETKLSGKANASHTHTIGNVTNLQSSLDAKIPTSRTVNGKALSSNITLSASDVDAYSKTEIDNMELITVSEIDAICGTTIQMASEVTY